MLRGRYVKPIEWNGKKYDHIVASLYVDENVSKERSRWVKDNIREDYIDLMYYEFMLYYFVCKNDALIFKMVWG